MDTVWLHVETCFLTHNVISQSRVRVSAAEKADFGDIMPGLEFWLIHYSLLYPQEIYITPPCLIFLICKIRITIVQKVQNYEENQVKQCM